MGINSPISIPLNEAMSTMVLVKSNTRLALTRIIGPFRA